MEDRLVSAKSFVQAIDLTIMLPEFHEETFIEITNPRPLALLAATEKLFFPVKIKLCIRLSSY